MPRVLVKTESRGWYLDAADPLGGKVRKTDGDQIFDGLLEAQEAVAVLKAAHGESLTNGDGDPEPAAKPRKEAPKEVERVTIKCAWIEGGKNDGTPYETVKLKSGKTIKGLTSAQRAKAHGAERQIKPQDLFQVRYCETHQKEQRKALRRAKTKARTAAKAKA